MPYQVIKDFKDLEDDSHQYHAGDKYPRSGRAKKDRVEELSGSSNKMGEPLIREANE